MANTGWKKFLLRAKYIGGVFQYNETNTEFLPDGVTPDPNYIAPVQDLVMCPLTVPVWSATVQATNSGVPSCSTSGSLSKWVDTSGTPVVGSQFYDDSSGSNKWTGGNGDWWGWNNSNNIRLRIAGGLVSGVSNTCIP